MYAVFKNNKFVSYSESKEGLEETHQLKEIPDNQRNLKLWRWVGDYDNGKMVHRYEHEYPELELEAEKQLFEIIEKSYPPGVQLTLVIKQLYKLSSHLNILNEEFSEMAEIVLTAVEKQAKRLKFYSKQK